MEEAEALANRIAILHRGRLRCIGHPVHLKNRFCIGYELGVKFSNMDPQFYQNVCQKISSLPTPRSPPELLALLNMVVNTQDFQNDVETMSKSILNMLYTQKIINLDLIVEFL